jgi:hypothetical protein|tara:strand:+ start:176 stop:394 length:219 start_codon:yes stop_codon:yes gene_type:complete
MIDSDKKLNKRSEQFYCASKKIGEQKCNYQCFDCKDYKHNKMAYNQTIRAGRDSSLANLKSRLMPCLILCNV